MSEVTPQCHHFLPLYVTYRPKVAPGRLCLQSMYLANMENSGGKPEHKAYDLDLLAPHFRERCRWCETCASKSVRFAMSSCLQKPLYDCGDVYPCSDPTPLRNFTVGLPSTLSRYPAERQAASKIKSTCTASNGNSIRPLSVFCSMPVFKSA